MFALEINFHDGVSGSDLLLVRRPHALIGTSAQAHVVLEGDNIFPYELHIVRGLGSEFFAQAVPLESSIEAAFGGVYASQTELEIGGISVVITPLDSDFALGGEESPDVAGLQVLRRALQKNLSRFPAVVVLGSVPTMISFHEGSSLLIGRSRDCPLRFESSEISGKHARIGYENGVFWVEDLGSTNGTFINGEQVIGRQEICPQERVVLGAEFAVSPVFSEEDIKSLGVSQESFVSLAQASRCYPCLVTSAEGVSPSRKELRPGESITAGRDPGNPVWINATHVSRVHFEITLLEDGTVEAKDLSSNGTFLGGERLEKEVGVQLPQACTELDLQEGVVFAVCHSEAEERAFLGLSEPSPGKEVGINEQEGFERSGKGDLLENLFSSGEEGEGAFLPPTGAFQKFAHQNDNSMGGLKKTAQESAQELRGGSASEQTGEEFDEEFYEIPQMSWFQRSMLVFAIGGLIILVFLLLFLFFGGSYSEF